MRWTNSTNSAIWIFKAAARETTGRLRLNMAAIREPMKAWFGSTWKKNVFVNFTNFYNCYSNFIASLCFHEFFQLLFKIFMLLPEKLPGVDWTWRPLESQWRLGLGRPETHQIPINPVRNRKSNGANPSQAGRAAWWVGRRLAELALAPIA